MAHVDHVVHPTLPALALKLPGSQLAHSRSLVAVAAALNDLPAMQGALTAVHAAPSSALEKLEPTVHAVHCRFAVALPALDWPSPAGQVDHAVHTRSLEVVATALRYVLPVHAAPTAVQASPAVEKVLPRAQAVHARSLVAVPAVVTPWPLAQDCHAAQLACPALEVNLPEAQSAQVRSELVVATAVVYVPATQAALTAPQAAPPEAEYLPVSHTAHSRSTLLDGTTVCSAPAAHTA